MLCGGMLDSLSEKFEKIFKKLRGSGVLTEQNIAEALKEVRLALLEADVNFKIVKDFIERVRVKAVGQEVLQSLTPGHQVVKVVWDELCEMMGRERAGLALASHPPTVVMMVGLQGAGKTTTCGKLGRYFKAQGSECFWLRQILGGRQPAISWRVWGAILRSTCIESIRPRLPIRMSSAFARPVWSVDGSRGTISSFWTQAGASISTMS